MQKLLSRQLAVVILLCGLRFAQSFFILSTKRIPLLSAPQVRFQRRVNLVAQCVASQNDDCNLHVAHDLKNKIVLPQDTTATLRNLVQLGDEWSRSSDTASIASSNSNTLRQSQFEKVSGCSSLVEIKTSLYASDSDSSDHPQHILVEGKADSRVTQGMLAVLCQIFNTLTLGEALKVDAEALTGFFGFDALLPMGRQNTFLNTVRLIQTQLQRLSSLSSDSASREEGGEEEDRVLSVAASLAEEASGACSLLQSRANPRPGASNQAQEETDEERNDAAMERKTAKAATIATETVTETATRAEPEEDPRASEVAVLLSGGVDSSVALRLLLQQGQRVRAYYLKIWLEDELAHLNSCPWAEDLRYAQAVCDQLGVPLETLSLQQEYWRDVVQYTLAEARAGRTPNPDVMCNSRVKFGTFYDYVGRFHRKIASGHYAQVMPKKMYLASLAVTQQSPDDITLARKEEGTDANTGERNKDEDDEDDEVVLLRAPDPVKDQSYFLCNLSQAQLRRCLFPIGHLRKTEVRALAEEFDLPTKSRRDSQGICFLGKLKFDDFIEHYLGLNPGPVVCASTGAEIGTHRGLWFHTIGQRKGLGELLKPGNVHAGPWYVYAKDVRRNTLFVSNDAQIAATAATQPAEGYLVEQVNWMNGVPAELLQRRQLESQWGSERQGNTGMAVQLKLRHTPHFTPGYIKLVNTQPKYKNMYHPSVPAESSNLMQTASLKSGDSASFYAGTVVRVQALEEGANVAPGQFVAFYAGDMCLGAGVLADLPPPVVRVAKNVRRTRT